MSRDRGLPVRRSATLAAAALALLLPVAALAAPAHPAKAAAPAPAPTDTTHIVAVVNGDVISNQDVSDRTRLFALSTGLPMSPEILNRLKPQIVQQLVDEKLRIQEILRRKIIIPDTAIAQAIHEIEQRNGLPPGALQQKLAADGVGLRTLIDQIRTQVGWSQVLRQQLGDQAQVSDAAVAEQQRLQAQLVGQPEFRVGEIFIPVDEPSARADAERFAETVISELRKGAAFGVVAAEFSQTQNALQGGEMGWVEANQLDPAVAQLVQEMPVGAISNPVTVPGGFDIVSLQGKRQIGNDIGTVLSMRQVFLPFSSPLNPQAPTEQQRAILEKARNISATTHSCDQMEQLAKANNSPRPANPGDVRLENVSPPAFKQMLTTIPLQHASQPLVANDGIAVVMVCSREQKNMATLTSNEVREHILAQRVELASRQLMQNLRQKATIQVFSKNGS